MTPKLAVQSLVDTLAAALRDRILTGQLAGGTALTEKDVSDYYDVARPTAKAALERLLYEGLLRRGINKTARVPLLGVDDVEDLYYGRGFIEREVVAALAELRRVPPGAQRAIADLRAAIRDEPVVSEIVTADVTFHRALVDALGSSRLIRMYQSVIGEAHLCMAQVQTHHLLAPTTIAAEHEAILAAIAAGDAAGATAAITGHLDRARQQLSSYLRHEHPDADATPGVTASGHLVASDQPRTPASTNGKGR